MNEAAVVKEGQKTSKEYLLEEMQWPPLERILVEHTRHGGNITWGACLTTRVHIYSGELDQMYDFDKQISEADYRIIKLKFKEFVEKDVKNIFDKYPAKQHDVPEELKIAADKLYAIGNEIIARSEGTYVDSTDIKVEGQDAKED
ncbi:MAG: hypothetical protein V4664_03525 [Patescibacteria group bacterium]